MQALTLRPATVDDLDRVMQLEAAGFAAGHRESRAAYARRIDVFAAGSLIAGVGNEDVGCFFSEIWRAADVPQVDHFRLGHDIGERHDAAGGDELYITSLTLHPAWRGRGLGAQLFAGGIAQVARAHPQLRSSLLLVNSNWRRARRIYIRQGFREIVRFSGFFTHEGLPAEDAIAMRRATR